MCLSTSISSSGWPRWEQWWKLRKLHPEHGKPTAAGPWITPRLPSADACMPALSSCVGTWHEQERNIHGSSPSHEAHGSLWHPQRKFRGLWTWNEEKVLFLLNCNLAFSSITDVGHRLVVSVIRVTGIFVSCYTIVAGIKFSSHSTRPWNYGRN